MKKILQNHWPYGQWIASIALGLTGPAHGVPREAAAEENAPVQSISVQEYLGRRASRMAAKLPELPQSVQGWDKRRSAVRQQLAAAFGLPKREPMLARVLRTWEEDGLIFEDLDYHWSESAYATAQIVRPKAASGRLPSIVSPPGWVGFLDQDCYKPWVCHMARHGYLVMFVDDPRVRRRTAPYTGFYALSSIAGIPSMGVQVFDNLRALDYLLTRPDVDSGRIGISGLCQGSEQTWLAAALEERFRVASPVCGTTTFEWWVRMPFFLGVNLSDPSPYLENILSWTDWHELGACIAPRPVLIASNSGDNWWPKPGFDKVVASMRNVYGLYGKPDCFEVVFDLRSHSMAPYTKEIHEWFDKHLKSLPPSEAESLPCGVPVDPDTSMIRYFQRRIGQQTASLPTEFADRRVWERFRGALVAWLRQSCDVEHRRATAPSSATRQEADGLVSEDLLLPQDEGLAMPLRLYYRPAAPKPRPAIVLSYDSPQWIEEPHVLQMARVLAGEGFLVAIPEHAGHAKASRRPVKSLISLYGAADAVGLPPLAMRVWDNLSCLDYLAGREDVDPRRIRIAGLGIGAVDAATTALLDERIAAVAAVGAITVRDWADTVAPRLGQFDRIMPYLPGIAKHTDWQYVYAAIAPRPLLLVDATDRDNWPEAAYQRTRKQAEQVYAFYGDAAKNLTLAPARSSWGIEELRRWAKSKPVENVP